MNQRWLSLVLVAVATGCGSNNAAPTAAPRAPELDPAPGAFQADFRDSGAFFTRMTEPRKGLSSSPHGIVQIFYSNKFMPAIGSDSFQASENTVAIKAQDQNGDGKVDTVQVMIKKAKGYDDFTHDWLFERYCADGTLDASGGSKLKFCVDCHNGFARTSELAATTLANGAGNQRLGSTYKAR